MSDDGALAAAGDAPKKKKMSVAEQARMLNKPEEKEKAAAAIPGAEVIEAPSDNARLLYPIPQFRDVHTDLNSGECVAQLKKGFLATVWVLDKSRSADSKGLGVVLHGTVKVDEFNDEFIFSKMDKKKYKTPETAKPVLMVGVGDFKEVRDTHHCMLNAKLRKQLPADFETRQLTLLHGKGLMDVNYLNIIPDDPGQLPILHTALKAMAKAAHSVRVDPTNKHLKSQYLHLPTDKSGNYPIKTLVGVLGKGHSSKEFQKALLHSELIPSKKVKAVERETLSFSLFRTLFNELEHRKDIDAIFRKLVEAAGGAKPAVDDERLPLAAFRAFLVDTQKIVLPEDEAASKGIVRNLITANEPNKAAAEALELTVDGFRNFLLSRECDAFDPATLGIHMDMNEPLSHYFIASSHNTYLTGHQLTGRSSVEQYIQVLLGSCRSVELDTWDGPNGEPIIYHGYTLVTKIKFLDVIRAIKKYTFANSPFPLILSIEDHCSIPQQQFMAKTFDEELADMLARAPTKEETRTTWQHVNPNLPSPQKLMRKILLKHKKRLVEPVEERKSAVQQITKKLSTSSVESMDFENLHDPEEEEEAVDEAVFENLVKLGVDRAVLDYEPSVSGKNVSQEISDLVVYTESVKFKSFDHARTNYTCNQMCSFPEKKAMILTKKYAREWLRHNTRQLSRIYPHGLRFDSSNYNPMAMWNCGVQMAALNYQTSDLANQLNRAMFDRNGRTGYILKPKPMRFYKTTMKPIGNDPIRKIEQVTLTIEVISGQHLPLGKSKTSSVTVQTLGLNSDTKTFKTGPKVGKHPIWNKEFLVPHLRLPEHVMVRFVVNDTATPCQRIVPLPSLREGYRHIQLRDSDDVPVEMASIFIRVHKEVHPDETVEQPEEEEEEEAAAAAAADGSSDPPATDE